MRFYKRKIIILFPSEKIVVNKIGGKIPNSTKGKKLVTRHDVIPINNIRSVSRTVDNIQTKLSKI